jgi:hypothetical protein
MLDRFMDYRERQQFRKDRIAKQRMRQLVIFMTILGVLSVVIISVQAIAPTEPAKTVKTEKVRKAEKTEPSDQQIQELTSKQAQYCYQINQDLPEPQLTNAIGVCESETDSWTIEQFDDRLGSSS